ncbi:MAG: hypothetical protein M3R51_02245 [Candidatus Eremiobacteraeota bacterium]|nr:hypothetical protein [Candidatus Eremiobacteraeota bacterium]
MLLIRLDAIGDAIVLAPLLHALRSRAIPVDLVLCESNADALSAFAARARTIAPFELRSRTRENRAAIATFGQAVRANAYTHTLVASEDAAGYDLARCVGSPAIVGFDNGWGKPFKTAWLRTILDTSVHRPAGHDRKGRHECEMLFDLARPLVNDIPPCRDAAHLRPFVLDSDVPRGDRVLLQISDKWERLGIAFSDVVRMVKLASSEENVRVVTAENELPYAARLANAAGVELEAFARLTDWKNAIGGARAIIAPDSGAIHVAGMIGTPTVAVFPEGMDFALQSVRWSPWASPFRAIAAEPQWPERAVAALRALLEAQHSAR